jgi:hypothetical protein
VKQQNPLHRPAKTDEGTEAAVETLDLRKTVRFAVSATAEVVDLRTRARISGRATDLGISGCYVDAMSPFPVGSAVAVRLASEGNSFYAKAKVVYASAGMGMGLFFTEMSADQNDTLRRWITALSGNSMTELPFDSMGGAAPGTQKPRTTVSGLRTALEDLLALLERKRVLTESEAEILRQKFSH